MKVLLLLMLFLCTSCEKSETNDVLHPVNTRSDSLDVKSDTDIYIEVDTILDEYDVDLIIKKKKG